MKLIYVAGAYSGISTEAIKRNIEKSIDFGESIYKLGYIPYVPHMFHYWDERHTKAYEDWMHLCFAVIPHCNGLVRMSNSISKGADREVQFARDNFIPIFYSLKELETYNWFLTNRKVTNG